MEATRRRHYARPASGDPRAEPSARRDVLPAMSLSSARDRDHRYRAVPGAAPKAGEFAEATRRIVGDERYAAESERLRKDGQRPAPAMNPADVDYQKYVYQGVRERATRKGDGKVSARASARRDVARKVKHKKARAR